MPDRERTSDALSRVEVKDADLLLGAIKREDLVRRGTMHEALDTYIIPDEYEGELPTTSQVVEAFETALAPIEVQTSFGGGRLNKALFIMEDAVVEISIGWKRNNALDWKNRRRRMAVPADIFVDENELGEESVTLGSLASIVNFIGGSPAAHVTEAAAALGFVPHRVKLAPRTKIPITFAFPSRRGIDYRSAEIERLPLASIEQNYRPEVMEHAKALVEELKTAEHGLVLIHGPVGTGKSYLIRSLLTEIRQARVGVVCSPPLRFLEQAGMLNEVATTMERSLIVLEDLGDVLETDASSRYTDVFSNLLNMTEGLLSLLANSVVLLSFNFELTKISPAVRRPGRCIGEIEVGFLTTTQAEQILGYAIPPAQKKDDYTLAEVYEMKREKRALPKLTPARPPIGLSAHRRN